MTTITCKAKGHYARADLGRLAQRYLHVVYLAIDAAIDVAWRRALQPHKPDDFFISPKSIADEIFHLAHQPKDALFFLAEARPYYEAW